jgi:predicted RNase H-like nuclease (RuvC/YqgF family)
LIVFFHSQEARAAHSVEMDALKGALARAEERVQSLEQQNAEQDARICELQEELEQV